MTAHVSAGLVDAAAPFVVIGAIIAGMAALSRWSERRAESKLPAGSREILAEERAAWKAGRAERWRSNLHMAWQAAVAALVLVVVLAIAIPALWALPPFAAAIICGLLYADRAARERSARLESELRAMRAEMERRT